MDEHTRALSALYVLDAGCNRETWVRIGMAAKAAGIELDEWIEWSSPAHNFGGERDCRQAWRSFQDGPTKAGTLFFLAQEVGWSDPARTNGTHKRERREPYSHNGGERTRIQASLAVREVWTQCVPATADHPYIQRKHGIPDELRVVPVENAPVIAGQNVGGWLAVPAVSLSGELLTMQFIPPDGASKKLNLPGASLADGVFIVGTIAEANSVYVCEGIGQAWACHRATGAAAVVSFGAQRLAVVAGCLRERYPFNKLVIVPDRGKERQAEEAAKSVRGLFVALPDDKRQNYDIGDLAEEYGLEMVAQLLENPRTPATRYRMLGAADIANAPPLHWIVRGVLPSNGLACIFGASGSGKSFLALDVCAAIAAGDDWFSCRVTPVPVVYTALEGESGFSQRVRAWQTRRGADMPPTLRFVMQPFDLRNPTDRADLCEAVKVSGSAGGLLVIDTLNRAASGADENPSADMGEWVRMGVVR